MKAKVTFVEVAHRQETIVEERILSDESAKELTKGCAAKLLARHYPEFKTGNRVIFVDTNRGWCALTAIQRSKDVWLYVYVAKVDS